MKRDQSMLKKDYKTHLQKCLDLCFCQFVAFSDIFVLFNSLEGICGRRIALLSTQGCRSHEGEQCTETRTLDHEARPKSASYTIGGNGRDGEHPGRQDQALDLAIGEVNLRCRVATCQTGY